MEDRLIAQVKRIYYDTKQAINECNFLTKQQLDHLLLTQNEEELILNVNGSQASLIKAATLLRELHARFLRIFVLSAFDLTWDMITTPKRFEYAKQKELELYNSLLKIANLKQDEIKSMIRESQSSIDDIIAQLTNIELPSIDIVSSQTELQLYRQEIQEFVLRQLNASIATKLIGSVESMRNSYIGTLERCLASLEQNCFDGNGINVGRGPGGGAPVAGIGGGGGYLNTNGYISSSMNSNSNNTNNTNNNSNINIAQNNTIANTNSMINTNNSNGDSVISNSNGSDESPHALLALRQILNAAYRVEVNVQSSTSVLRVLWEKMKQLLTRGIPMWSLYWNNYGVIDEQWKRQQALDIIDNLDEGRLAKSICSQFRARLKASHEQFLLSIKELELQHANRLQQTEDLRLRVRKLHAPRMAKFALESTSLIDLILYGLPCLEKEIGRGQYGVVYGCESWAGHSPCAVKSVVPPDDKHWYDLAMEFYYTRCIPEHERIVSIYGSVIDHSYGSGSTPAVLLIMQRLNRDLYSAIKSGLDWLLRLQVAIDVVKGIRFLHNQGLVHRDIKLKNILLDENNRAKITDLGFCKPEAMMSGSVVGTPIHMSPELFSGRYDNSVDVYAFGILFWYICAGHVRLPHIFEQCQTRDQLWNCVRRGVRPERLPQFDNECWQLMVQCWDGDRSKRPHLGDVEIKLRQIYARYV